MTDERKHEESEGIVLYRDFGTEGEGGEESGRAELAVDSRGEVRLTLFEGSPGDQPTDGPTALRIDGRQLADLIKEHVSSGRRQALEKERAYLEGLLTTRVSWYMTFVAFYLFAVFEKLDPIASSVALLLGCVMSASIAYSISRTVALVEEVLSEYRRTFPSSPYAVASFTLGMSWNHYSANRSLAWFPRIATAAFLILAVLVPVEYWMRKSDALSAPIVELRSEAEDQEPSAIGEGATEQ